MPGEICYQSFSMTWEEREILAYLKSSPKAYYSAREISRRAAGKQTFKTTPDWAKPLLPELVRKGVIETDGSGHFRLKSNEPIEAKGRQWVSPHIAKLLKKTGKDFSKVVTTEIADESE